MLITSAVPPHILLLVTLSHYSSLCHVTPRPYHRSILLTPYPITHPPITLLTPLSYYYPPLPYYSPPSPTTHPAILSLIGSMFYPCSIVVHALTNQLPPYPTLLLTPLFLALLNRSTP